MLSNGSFATSEGSRPRCSNDRILAEIREKLINEAIKVAVRLIEKDYQQQNEARMGGLGKYLESIPGTPDKMRKEQQEKTINSIEDFTRKNLVILIKDLITQSSSSRQARCTATIVSTLTSGNKSEISTNDMQYNVILTDEGNTIWRIIEISKL